MTIEPGQLQHRVLRILKHKKGGKTIYTIAPFDALHTKTGTTYYSPAPQSDNFVNEMLTMEYDQIEYLDAPGMAASAGAGTDQLIMNSPDMALTRH